MIRKNECGWKRHYYLTPDRLSFGSRSTENGQDVVKVFSVELGGGQIDVAVTEPLVTSVLHSVERDNPKPTRNSRPLFISHSTSGIVVKLPDFANLRTRALLTHFKRSGRVHKIIKKIDIATKRLECRFPVFPFIQKNIVIGKGSNKKHKIFAILGGGFD